MATTGQPRVRRKQTIEQSMSIIRGNEPTTTKQNFKCDLIRALNWYNANWDESAYRKAAEHYVVKHMKIRDAAYALSKASNLEIRPIAVIGRLIEREQYVDLDYVERVFKQIEDIKTKYIKTNVRATVADTTASTGVSTGMSIQDRITESARQLASEVDYAIDQYTADGTEFSMKNFLLANQVSAVVAKKIGSFYEPLVKQLDQAITGKCDQLKEGYSQYTRRGLKQFADFVRQIVVDCNQHAVSTKAARKPRARKAKPASVIVKKLSYMKEYPELNLKSISAEKIIGATELWVYNTATRKLIVYYGADNGYLGVSGTSITNYDVEKSSVKTIRNPEQFFKALSSTGKRAINNAWKSIRAKTSKPRSRINGDMILLAAN